MQLKPIPVESLAKPIRNLPRETQILIYSFTSEFARRYARHLGFKNFGSINNEVFTDNYFKVIETLDIYSAKRLWKIECNSKRLSKTSKNFSKIRKDCRLCKILITVVVILKRKCIQISTNRIITYGQ